MYCRGTDVQGCRAGVEAQRSCRAGTEVQSTCGGAEVQSRCRGEQEVKRLTDRCRDSEVNRCKVGSEVEQRFKC